ALAQSPHLRGLRALDLSSTNTATAPIRANDVQAFLAALQMPDLRQFDLGQLPVGAGGARTIAAGGPFANLVSLGLNQCGLREAGARAIAESTALDNLVVLQMVGNAARSGVKRLADRKVLPQLADCDLTNNRLPKSVVSRLHKRPGVSL